MYEKISANIPKGENIITPRYGRRRKYSQKYVA